MSCDVFITSYLFYIISLITVKAVSYTHLDVYKRQVPYEDQWDRRNNIQVINNSDEKLKKKKK